mmetsp:Transcript_4504/g.9851  ORF Transcript_4504/g.9851 Transcript_4504/m.9851 type:complete len:102 (-) Transcript_4504:482-787(-)
MIHQRLAKLLQEELPLSRAGLCACCLQPSSTRHASGLWAFASAVSERSTTIFELHAARDKRQLPKLQAFICMRHHRLKPHVVCLVHLLTEPKLRVVRVRRM